MQGILQLKRDHGGWRHYIVLPDGTEENIYCGTPLVAQFDGGWIEGRYECSNLGPDWNREQVKPRLIVQIIDGITVDIPLVIGCRIRREG